MPECQYCYGDFEDRTKNKCKIFCSRYCASQDWYEKNRKLPEKYKYSGKRVYIPLVGVYRTIYLNNNYPACSYKRKNWFVHRLVAKFMLEINGEKLSDFHTVHHIDKNKLNFQPENLQIVLGNHGNHGNLIDEISLYKKTLDRLGYDVIKKAA